MYRSSREISRVKVRAIKSQAIRTTMVAAIPRPVTSNWRRKEPSAPPAFKVDPVETSEASRLTHSSRLSRSRITPNSLSPVNAGIFSLRLNSNHRPKIITTRVMKYAPHPIKLNKIPDHQTPRAASLLNKVMKLMKPTRATPAPVRSSLRSRDNPLHLNLDLELGRRVTESNDFRRDGRRREVVLAVDLTVCLLLFDLIGCFPGKRREEDLGTDFTSRENCA